MVNTTRQFKKPTYIALIQWFVTNIFQIDRLFYEYDVETPILIVSKILYLIILILAWNFGFKVHKMIKSGNAEYIRGWNVFKFYLIIMMVFMLSLWPGTWSWDDFWTIESVRHYNNLYAWQHVLTSIYYDVLLQILPFPGGVILLQNLIISLCVSYIVVKLENIYGIASFKNKYVDILIKVLPFLLPPVLIYQFSGYRIGLYMYLELVMIIFIIDAIKGKEKWGYGKLFLFSFLLIIVSVWRTESIVYLPIACILICMVNNTVISWNRKILCIVIVVIGFWGINSWQKYELGDSNYEVISLARPCAEVVRASDREMDAELLNAIDKVVKIEIIDEFYDTNGESLYWNYNLVRDGYTKQEYSEFVKAFIKLCLRHPKVVIKERMQLFMSSIGMTEGTVTNIDRGAALYDAGGSNSANETLTQMKWIANQPVFKTLRKFVMYSLGCRTMDGSRIPVIYNIIWNAVIPIIALVAIWVELLIRKKWKLLLLATAVVTRIPIVALTQPANWFMYVLPFYLVGYVYIIYRILMCISWRKKHE